MSKVLISSKIKNFLRDSFSSLVGEVVGPLVGGSVPGKIQVCKGFPFPVAIFIVGLGVWLISTGGLKVSVLPVMTVSTNDFPQVLEFSV